jgi:hypothetical protein
MTFYGIALGHNQTPVALHLLNAPLFEHYEFGLLDEWVQGRIIAGDKSAKLLKPLVRWPLAAITEDERDWLGTNIYTAPSVLLSIRTPDRSASDSAFTDYNCTGYWHVIGDGGQFRAGVWQGVILEFVKLVEQP